MKPKHAWPKAKAFKTQSKSKSKGPGIRAVKPDWFPFNQPLGADAYVQEPGSYRQQVCLAAIESRMEKKS